MVRSSYPGFIAIVDHIKAQRQAGHPSPELRLRLNSESEARCFHRQFEVWLGQRREENYYDKITRDIYEIICHVEHAGNIYSIVASGIPPLRYERTDL